MVEEKNIGKEQFFCARLFSLIWSAVKGGHYVTSSVHMADCVTAKHTGGGVEVVVGCCGKGRMEGGQTDKRKETGPWKIVVDGRERKKNPIAAHIGVGSHSLLRLLSQAAVMWALRSLIMRHENAR